MITRFYCVKRRVPRSVTENMSLPYLGAMLTSRMGCRTNEDELVVLRFWDPRILLGLPSARDAEQRRHFFAPVVEWTAWEPRRQQYYTITAPPDAAPVPRFAVMPMALSLAQRDQLMYYDKEALYERIVSYWHETCADAIDGLEADMLREVAIAAVARCSSYGIHSADDQVLFASLMMAVSPSFDDHPAVQRGLRDQTVAPDERLDRLITRRLATPSRPIIAILLPARCRRENATIPRGESSGVSTKVC